MFGVCTEVLKITKTGILHDSGQLGQIQSPKNTRNNTISGKNGHGPFSMESKQPKIAKKLG